MFFKYFQDSIRGLRHKLSRSLLAVLGLILGVTAAALVINTGLGLQQQVVNHNNLNTNLLTLRSGQAIISNDQGQIIQYNLSQAIGTPPTLDQIDLDTMTIQSNITKIAPIVNLNQAIKDNSGDSFLNGHVLATNHHLLDLANLSLEHGLNTLDSNRPTIIIGEEVAKELFNDSRPISGQINLDDQTYTIAGILKQPRIFNPLNIGFNYNRAVLLPYDYYIQNNPQTLETPFIYEIMAHSDEGIDSQFLNNLENQILINHNQEKNFSLFQNSDLLFLTNNFFDVMRSVMIIIALFFFAVGGFSLMHALKASFLEKKLEISLRKVVGATNQQILKQFLVEAGTLGLIGGILGILLAISLTLIIDFFLPFGLVLQTEVLFLMLILSISVSLIFGSPLALWIASQDTAEGLK